MRFVQFLSLATAVASTALHPLSRLHLRYPSTLLSDASPRPLRTTDKPIEPFSISDLYSESFVDSSTTWNRSLSFVFADPNSNTETICSQSWIDSNGTSTAPTTTYAQCDDTADDERFQWQFASYTGIQHFSIKFSHGWDDPAEYAPPYTWVTMSSTENSFNMTCATNAEGLQHCTAPQNPYHAGVDGIVN